MAEMARKRGIKVTNTKAYRAFKKKVLTAIRKGVPWVVRKGVFKVALATGAAMVVTGPILVVAGAALVAYDIYNLYTEYAKSELPLKIADGAVKVWNKLFGYHLIYPRDEENQHFYVELFDFLNPLPAAQASFISPVARMASQVGKSAYKEVNNWIFSPVGRMIVFGAIGTFTGIVTKKTLQQISNVQNNLAKLKITIQKFDEATQKGSRFEDGQSSIWEGMSDVLLSKAHADERTSGLGPVELPNKLSCVTYPGRSCVSLKSTLKKRTPKYDKYPKEFTRTVNKLVQAADSVQGRKTITPRTMNSLKEIGKEGAYLLELQKNVFKEVNHFRQKNGVKKINFERKGNDFFGRLGKDVKNILNKSKISGKDVFSGLGMNSYGKEFEKTNVKFDYNFSDEDESYSGQESNDEESPLVGAVALEAQIVEDEKEETEKKSSKKPKGKSIFDIISSRYRLKYLDLVPD